MTVATKGLDCSPREIEEYKKYLAEKFPNCEVTELILEKDDDDPEYVKMHYTLKNKPEHNQSFTRLRRITGYLGNIARINNAKQHEIEDRVMHD